MKKLLLLVFSATLMLFLTTNVMAQNGKQVKVANNSELVKALDDPTVTSIEFTQEGFYEEIAANIHLGDFIIKDENGSRANCIYSFIPNDVCFDGSPTASVAEVFTTTPSGATCPGDDSGEWSVVSGPGTVNFLDPLNEYVMNFTATQAGEYTLKYDWGGAYGSAEFKYRFYERPVVVLTNDLTACATIPITVDITPGSFLPPASTLLQEWSVSDGSVSVSMVTPTLDVNNSFDFDPADAQFSGSGLQVCGGFTVTVTATNSNGPECGTTQATSFYIYDTPTGVEAGSDENEVCGLTATLTGAATPVSCNNTIDPTYEWSTTDPQVSFGTVSGTAYTATSTTVTVPSCGSYEFTYEVTNGDCSTISKTSVYFYDAPTASIADVADQCGTTTQQGGYTATVALFGTSAAGCDNGEDLEYSWTSDPATGVTFSGVYPGVIEDPEVTVTACGTYEFTMWVTNGACTTSSTTTVNFFDKPDGVTAVPDEAEVCGLTTGLTGSYYTLVCDDFTTVAWTTTSKPSGADDAVFGWTTDESDPTVTVTTCGTYEFTYTVTNGACETTSTTTVKFYDTPTNVTITDVADVCWIDNTSGATLTGSTPTINCANGTTTTYGWSKTSGPGTVNWTTATNTTVASFTVDACGTYEFEYLVTNGPCSEVSTTTVNFYSKPTDVAITTAPAKVCGYTTDLVGEFVADCDNNATMAWTVTPATGVTFGTGTASSTTVTVTTCGEYTFTYTVTNLSGCETSSSTNVIFYETPDITVAQGTPTGDVYTCSEVTYTVTNVACGTDLWDYNWQVAGGSFVGVSTGTTVTIAWDQTSGIGAGTVTCTANTTGLQGCADTDDLSVDLIRPTLEGQVKYWNASETYMPSPFPTDFYGTFPEDYFYVTLYTTDAEGDPDVEVATAYVQPRLMEDLTELMSYFNFTVNTDEYGCDEEYLVKIWDGGLSYHPNPPVNSGTSLGASYTYNNWGGVNATDALAIQLMVGAANDIQGTPWNYTWVGSKDDVSPCSYGYYSHSIADVNYSNPYTDGGITALDALTAKYRTVGLLGSFPDNYNYATQDNQFSGNFMVTGRMVTSLAQTTFPTPFALGNPTDVPFIADSNDYLYFTDAETHKFTSFELPLEASANYMNIYYEAKGDINASYVPTSAGFKAEPNIELYYEGLASSNVGSEMVVPVSIDRDATIGAITLSMNFRNDLIEVLGTNFSDDDVFINQEEGILNMAWFNTTAIDVVAEGAIAQIKVRVLAEIPEGTELFSLNVNTELADAYATPIEDINLKTIGVTTDMNVFNGTELTAVCYPNPFSDATTINYTLPEAGKVVIEVYNNMGMIVKSLISETQEAGVHNVLFNAEDARPGVYFYHITVQGTTKNFSTVKRMIVTQ